MRCVLGLILNVFSILNAFANDSLSQLYLGSRESDPASIVENVSTTHGDYSEYEIDLIVPGPDSLVLSRFYSSRDDASMAALGGWRFFPQCILIIQKDPKRKPYTTAEGKFEKTYAYVGTPEGSILTYSCWQNANKAISLFKVDLEEKIPEATNSARGIINAWTNLKNNELYFYSQNDNFELLLNTGGKRFYVKNPSLNIYVLEKEILPSGNKIFYEYDNHSRPTLIKMMNHTEKKILSWISIQYGDTTHITSSDGKTIDYQFEQDLLIKVLRSHKPSLQYQYRVVDEKKLLIKKLFPEGRFTEIDYYTDINNKHKVKSITNPADISDATNTHFIYGFETDGSGFTEIISPLNRKTVHRFNEDLQLTSIEHYLGGSLYRVQRKIWGKKGDFSNLIATIIQDEKGNAYYAKTFSYDIKGNVLEEREYGNLTGANPFPIVIDEEGIPDTSQESHTKTCSYQTDDDEDIVDQMDPKGNGIRFVYKKGTSVLIRKSVFKKKDRKKRWFYAYDEDGALIQIISDDGEDADVSTTDDVYERHITQIICKQEFPNVGAPEVVEEKYLDIKTDKEVLLKRIVNHFDAQGNVDKQEIYDANCEYCYALKKTYENGLLKMESDPAGNETYYSYDTNHNLISKIDSKTGITITYGYDFKNRLIYTAEQHNNGHIFETRTSYDPSGCKLFEIDKFGNQTIYVHDDLDRILSVSYSNSTYTYQYDLFDHITSVTNPKDETTVKTNTLRGQPVKIEYPDGTKELFKYDLEGSLHRHLSQDGTVKVFEYDYHGRLEHIEHYGRSSKESGEWLSSIRYSYDAFHLISEKDEEENVTSYTYDDAGRLQLLEKDSKKVEFIYDALGRTKAIKKWKTKNTFTLQVKEYDVLDQVIEERIEDSKGNTLLKYKYVYNSAGLLAAIIGYPENQESVLNKYDYDGFGRLISIKDVYGQATEMIYDDGYHNELGQKVLKQTTIDPLGNQKEEIFDVAGHLVKTIQKNKQGQVLTKSESTYDVLGNELLAKHAVLLAGDLIRTYETEQTYGPNSQLKKWTASEKETSFEYDLYGNLSVKAECGAKTPIVYQYDYGGKLTSITYQESAEEVTYTLSYDSKGNIRQTKFGSTFILTHKFDSNDQLISETVRDEFGSYQVGYELDGEGLIQSIRLPDASYIQYDYSGPFVQKVSHFTKDKKELYKHQIVKRDLMGNVLEEILIDNAGARNQKWDPAGRRAEISTDFFQDKVPEDGYDPLNNIRKREIVLDDEPYTIDYEYDALSQLISEKGEFECLYCFDSLGNRLQKDNVPYKINHLNQVLEANRAIYTFDLSGNLSSKTIGEKTWTFQHNPLNQLILIKAPDQTIITFNYDLNGRRLLKKIQAKGKKAKILRYFYIGQTEIGCLDEKGAIVELRIPSDPNNPEITPFVAFEIKKEIFTPIYDLQGNVTCLIDPQKRKIAETYYFSAFGEEKIINERRKIVSDSSLDNPWRFRGKRIDKEIGLIYFGHRYYDPELGRWISPDPAGNIDGPNLYAFCHNNPLTYVDCFGLASETNNARVDEKYFYGEYEPHCYCERHRNCKRGGDIGNIASLGGPNFTSAGIGKVFQIRSIPYEMGSIDLANGEIGFINGIDNSLEEAKSHALRLSQYAQSAKIHGIYNATHSTPIDILECILGQCRIPSPPVLLLKNRWNSFISTHEQHAKYFQICHSGGAIHVFNALSYSSKAVRDRIIVLAISPGAIIPKSLCYEAYNYASNRDYVPKCDIIGNLLYGDQLSLLEPHPDASKHDHGFDSPTFQVRIKNRIMAYIRQSGELK